MPRMPKLQTLTDRPVFVNSLFWGEAGGGKTTAAAALANVGPIVYVNAEGGLEKPALERRGVKVDNIQVYPGEEGAPILYDELEGIVYGVRADLKRDPDAWAGVVFDSGGEMAAILKDNAVTRHKTSWDDQGRDYTDFTFNEQPAYGVMTDQMRRLIRGLRDAPCHFAMTCLPRTSDVAGKFVPDINPALQQELIGHMRIAVWCRSAIDGDLYIGDVVSSRKFTAKDRLDVLPRPRMATPHMDRIIQYVNGELDASSDPEMRRMAQLRKARKSD